MVNNTSGKCIGQRERVRLCIDNLTYCLIRVILCVGWTSEGPEMELKSVFTQKLCSRCTEFERVCRVKLQMFFESSNVCMLVQLYAQMLTTLLQLVAEQL